MFLSLLLSLLTGLGAAGVGDGQGTAGGGDDPATAEAPVLRFVQLTDTHIGDGDHLARTRRAVRAINALPMAVDCVVHTGDITMDLGEDAEVVARTRAALAELEAPLHLVPGNHDILPERLEPSAAAYREKFGGLIASAEYKGTMLVFVYTEPLRERFAVPGYRPLEDLERELERAGDKPVIVFHHAPSVGDFYKNRMHPGWRREVREQWVDLLNRHAVTAVVAGHFHRDELHWLGEVPLYVCPPVAGYWGRQGAYRIYELRDGRLGYRTQYLR